MTGAPQPPKLARRALAIALPADAREHIVDELDEVYRRRCEQEGVAHALGIASGLALILGAVGLYGVLSYVVSQRTREIAVRMALGAEAPAVRRMVVLQGGRVALAGVGLGVLVALGVTGVLESLLFGVKALDALTFMAMSGLMLAVALLASYIPAHRASSVDPIQALRAE